MLPQPINKLIQALQKQGFQAFIVGGFVRDLTRGALDIKGAPCSNIDIATSADPRQVEELLKHLGLPRKPVGRWGTILTVIDSVPVEITTFRSEGPYSDRRHPTEITFVKSFLQDAKRRDFTINALYFDPITKKIYDPANGKKDLNLKLIRFVGDPRKRIDEDGLRLLRAVRFATQLGFGLEKNCLAAIKIRAKYIQEISGERVKQELDKILLSPNRAAGLRLLDQTGLLRFIIPEMEAIKRFFHKSKMYHLEGSIFDHTLLALSKVKDPDLDLLYALLFHDVGKPQTAQRVRKAEGWVISTRGHADISAEFFLAFARGLKFSARSRDRIAWLIRQHMLMENFYDIKLVKQLPIMEHPAFPQLLEHWKYDDASTIRAGQDDPYHDKCMASIKSGLNLLKRLKQKRKLIDQLADGNFIMKHSDLKPGIKLGQTIAQVRVWIVQGQIRNQKDLVRRLTILG